MQCQHHILGIRWSDCVTKSAVTKKTGLPDIRAVINDKKLALFRYVRCLPEGTSPTHDVHHASVESHADMYHILVSEESQEDYNVHGYVTF